MSLGNIDPLAVIQEEQASRHSSVNINDIETVESVTPKCHDCDCQGPPPAKLSNVIKMEDVEVLFQERLASLRQQFEKEMKNQISSLKQRFDFILENEQVRTWCMMREAHRERQEKIAALQTQLECKNLAGLMYVMCSERRRGKLEKMRILEEYTSYIRGLQEILTDAQQLILDLSRGYKTAARVDHEWREKMLKIIKEFQAYVVNYNGGTPESNQYIFDLPALLKTTAPLKDNLNEDPCDGEEEELSICQEPVKEDLPWWEQLEGDCRPFVMFGDMADFTPPQRRETLRSVKAVKTAPRKWKKYVFNEMYLKSDCSHLDFIKYEQEKRFPMPTTWECRGVQTLYSSPATMNREESLVHTSKYDLSLHRLTSQDARGMGSILKIITAGQTPEPVTKATLLGARDSMEIKSTTLLKVKHGAKKTNVEEKLEIGHRHYEDFELDRDDIISNYEKQSVSKDKGDVSIDAELKSMLGSVYNDSLQLMTSHKPDPDHKINYEKVCPMEKCKRMQVDSFMRSLPPYMKANPYLDFAQTFDNYETCSPEQLEILKKRIEAKKRKKYMVQDSPMLEDGLEEFGLQVEGVSCQTSWTEMYLPPCTCELPASSAASSEDPGAVFRIEDLLPIKKALNEIKAKCFFDDDIDFNRFKVIGQESDSDVPKNQEDFNKKRFTEIKRILKKHPSLCDLFQARTS